MQKLKKIGLTSVAAAGSAALVLGLSSAPAMAAGTFDTTPPTISAPTSIYLPSSSSSKTIDFSVTITGPGTPYSYKWGEAKTSMQARNDKIPGSYVKKTFSLYPAVSGTQTPGTKPWTGNVYSSITTPGKYRMSVPVTQYNGATALATKAAKNDIVIKASPTASRNNTSATGSGYIGHTWTMTVRAPYYQVGAYVAIYAKRSDQSSYHKATTAVRLANYTEYSSRAKLKLPGKYTKKGTKFYVKVASAPYAPAYKRTGYYIS